MCIFRLEINCFISYSYNKMYNIQTRLLILSIFNSILYNINNNNNRCFASLN